LQWKVPYEDSTEPLPGCITGLGGSAVISQAFRSMQLPGACEANLGMLRKIGLGFKAGEMVETGVIGVLLGADSVEDLGRLHDDEAVAKILGYRPCSVRSFRDWLEKSENAGSWTAISNRRFWYSFILAFTSGPDRAGTGVRRARTGWRSAGA
jgi:hypothetical protein